MDHRDLDHLDHVVVVGASLAGVRACGGLRAAGFDGSITLIGAEAHPPYDRPPLSKKVLSGEWDPDRIILLRQDELDALRLDQRLGVPAVSLSTDDRRVTLADGTIVPYDAVVLATGALLRRLPCHLDHPSLFELRTLDDSLALRTRLAPGDQRVTVIGAGFIGLEVAATARLLGNTVTVLEGAPAPLIRGLGAEMGRAVTAIHTDHDVMIHCDVDVQGIQPAVGGGTGLDVRIGGGSGSEAGTIASDIVVIGVGVAPATAWLADSGLELRDGVVCDATLNALGPGGVGIPGVYAAGDIARWPNGQFDGEEMRVEHWTNAAEQGLLVASNLLADRRGEEPQPYSTVPFFWSDQFDKRIQFIGRAAGDDDVCIVRGSVEDRSFLALYGKHGQLRGALGLSMPKPLMRTRKLLLERLSFEEAIEAVAEFP